MKKILTIIICLFISNVVLLADNKNDGTVKVENLKIQRAADNYVVTMQLNLDNLKLSANHQIFVTPYVENGTNSVQLKSVLLNGRNMHYVYQRSGVMNIAGHTKYDVKQEYYHKKGTTETIDYAETIAAQPWMRSNDTKLTVVLDTCGCGRPEGSDYLAEIPAKLNPVEAMTTMPYPTPTNAAAHKLINHHGKARVQFEVDRIELHEEPYRCKNGQLIDNRAELKIIDDSIHYALTNPNVEIASLIICGYASPESPYMHNEYLASNRSRVLTEYIESKYHLPHDRCTYTSVTENWEEFREQVLAATDITEQQRQDLLELIDRRAYGAADYDAKETELKTSPKFAKLYAEKILPKWFPHLRATSFQIITQLKPLTATQLRQVLDTTPELMSLSEIYRAANSYEHGSEGFLKAMRIALQYYPDDEMANCNAAAVAVEAKDYEAALKYLAKSGESDDANILRGIIETEKGNYEAARAYFQKASGTPQAQTNLRVLDEL